MLGVPRAHFDQVAVVPGDVMDLQHLRALSKRLRDADRQHRPLASNRDERQERQPERLGSTRALYPRMTPLASSFRIRSMTADGARPTSLAISVWVSRALG